jgi:hypothetical protein
MYEAQFDILSFNARTGDWPKVSMEDIIHEYSDSGKIIRLWMYKHPYLSSEQSYFVVGFDNEHDHKWLILVRFTEEEKLIEFLVQFNNCCVSLHRDRYQFILSPDLNFSNVAWTLHKYQMIDTDTMIHFFREVHGNESNTEPEPYQKHQPPPSPPSRCDCTIL